jgi:GH25 family lysozyme M1 (1,4-beta-N-acetylmuramidase)
MKIGMDFSEHNGHLPWDRLAAAGLDFALLRLGWGKGHLDTLFFENVNEAWARHIPLGLYYYSYALTPLEAREEAAFAFYIIQDSGLGNKIPLGLWLDMEDADGWKQKHGVQSPEEITGLTKVWLEEIKDTPCPRGIYASFDWLTRLIDLPSLGNPPTWCAQWARKCDIPRAKIWQFTDRLTLAGIEADGDILF